MTTTATRPRNARNRNATPTTPTDASATPPASLALVPSLGSTALVSEGTDTMIVESTPVMMRHTVTNQVVLDDAKALSGDRHGVGFVDLEGKARVEHQASVMRYLGHAVEATVYPIGYTVNDIGVDNARAKRAEVDAMPHYATAFDQLSAIVKLEDRRDLIGNPRNIRMLADGSIQTTSEFREVVTETDLETNVSVAKDKIYPAGFILKPEELSLLDLAQDIKASLPAGSPIPAALSQTLVSSPPMLRAQIVNFWQDFDPTDHGIPVPQKAQRDTHGRFTGDLVPIVNADKTRKLRTRVQNGERTLYATVGEDFPPIDVDMVAAIARFACSQIDGDLRARCDYDGRNVRITIISHSTVDPRLYVAGEVFRASAFLGTDDTGGGAIWGYGALDRNLCRNLIILQNSKAGAFRVEHRGMDMEKLINEIVDGVKHAFASVAVFAELWSGACESALYLPEGVTSAPKVLREAAEVFALNAAAMVTKRDRSGKHLLSMRGSSDASRVQNLVPSLLGMWRKEMEEPSSAMINHNGLTRAALVNAMTRYAHEVEGDAFRGSELEREAGDLLTAKPWKLPSVEQWNDWGTSPEAVVASSGIV